MCAVIMLEDGLGGGVCTKARERDRGVLHVHIWYCMYRILFFYKDKIKRYPTPEVKKHCAHFCMPVNEHPIPIPSPPSKILGNGGLGGTYPSEKCIV